MLYNYAIDQGQYAQQNRGNYGVNPMAQFQGPMYPANFQPVNQMQQQMSHQQLAQMQWNNQMGPYYGNYAAPRPQFAPMASMAPLYPNFQHHAPAQWNFQNQMPFNNAPAPMFPENPMYFQGPSVPAQMPPNAYNFIQPDAPAHQDYSNFRQSASYPTPLVRNSVDSTNIQTSQEQEASNDINSDIPVSPSSPVPAPSSSPSPPLDQIQDQDDEFQYDLDQEDFDPFEFEELLQQENDEIAQDTPATSSVSAPDSASSSDSSDALVDPVVPKVQEANESDSNEDIKFEYHLDQNEFDLAQWEKLMEDDDIVEELPSLSTDMAPSPSSDDSSSTSLPSILGSCEENPITLDEDSVPVTQGSDDVVLLDDDIKVIPTAVQSPIQQQFDQIRCDALIDYNVMISEAQDVQSTSSASSSPSNSRYSPYAKPCIQVRAPCNVQLISGELVDSSVSTAQNKKKKSSRPRAQRKPRSPKAQHSVDTASVPVGSSMFPRC